MQNDFTDITIVLDRSGSMFTIWEETISSFASFVRAQAEAEGRCQISLRLFDDQHDNAFVALSPTEINARDSLGQYPPRGWTAMLDAIGKGIVETGERLAQIPEDERPANVLFVVITDGLENASKEYKRTRIAEMIKHQQEKYGWDFSIMGANMDTILTGAEINIGQDATMNFASTNAGVKSAMDTLAVSASLYRSAKISNPKAKYVVQNTDTATKSA